jgi:hypothetical protein
MNLGVVNDTVGGKKAGRETVGTEEGNTVGASLAACVLSCCLSARVTFKTLQSQSAMIFQQHAHNIAAGMSDCARQITHTCCPV